MFYFETFRIILNPSSETSGIIRNVSKESSEMSRNETCIVFWRLF